MTVAATLPLGHLSVRVPWNDTNWTGVVCADPASNNSCSVLRNVIENRDLDLEDQHRGQKWQDGQPEQTTPPCALERGGFMRESAFTVIREHAYATKNNRATHGHFRPTAHRMPAYSFEAVPFRWMMRENAPALSATWGIPYDPDQEERVDRLMSWSSTWVQDHRNQTALLDGFFSAINPGTSLVFIYAKDVPLLEERAPGARILIGAGRVTDVGPAQEWTYELGGPFPVRSMMWERAIGHSIRPNFADGFLLPYQQLMADPTLAGADLQQFIAWAPDDHWDEFSMASEQVSHDGAIAALTELARVVSLLPGVADGPWDQVSSWISDRVADVWALRGPYPGLGSALTACGIEFGGLIAHRLSQATAEGQDAWEALVSAFAEADTKTGPIADLVGRMGRKAWQRVLQQPERRDLLRLLARIPLTPDQARRYFSIADREAAEVALSDSDVLSNPYLMVEHDRLRRDAISLFSVDRAMFPQDAASRLALDRAPLPEPVTESADDRRIRAASTHILEVAASEGHTVLDEIGLRRRLADLPLVPPCDPPAEIFDLAQEEFHPTLIWSPLTDGSRAWQLDRLASCSETIRSDVENRLGGTPLDVRVNCRALIDAAIDGEVGENPDEERARVEKAQALELLLRSRVAALIGPAGTGKTTMLRALTSAATQHGRGVLLLAPTGKARVQLGDRAGTFALTVAQFLRPSGRWHHEFGYRLRDSARKTSDFSTVVIDEASMLTEDMLAAVIDAVSDVDRLILVGDPRQLPPIGAGRPFVDLIEHLRGVPSQNSGSRSGGVAELTIVRRQRSAKRLGSQDDRQRDDLALAQLFAADLPTPAGDETLARIIAGEGDGTVEIVTWSDQDDLHELVVDRLSASDEFRLADHSSGSLAASLGAKDTYNGRPSFTFGKGGNWAEAWQILSPVRHRDGGVDGLNALVRRTWRPNDLRTALRSWRLPAPMGSDQILFHDKVMCVDNHSRDAYWVGGRNKSKGDIANGEIGMAVSWTTGRGKPEGLKVEFSTQPGCQYTFWASQLNGERDEVLQLAYAVTVHKAQGSQFGTTYVVVPNPCPLLSPELLYTALTRHRDRVVLFIQGDPLAVRAFANPLRSATASRLTNLFQAPDPYILGNMRVLDGNHIHRTAQGDVVISKSEVIVGDTLTRLGVTYQYERELVMPDGSRRLPDFTIHRQSAPPIYWEHLGMLDRAGYRADWEAKKAWYERNGIGPWTEGGGPNGTLVWSTEGAEGRGIDSVQIEALARQVLGLPAA